MISVTAGDEMFLANDLDLTRPYWVKKVLVALSALGGFCALVMVMLGFVHLPLLVVGGAVLAVGSVLILGDRTTQWVLGWLAFLFAAMTFFLTPSLATSLPQSMSPLLFLSSAAFALSLQWYFFIRRFGRISRRCVQLENELD